MYDVTVGCSWQMCRMLQLDFSSLSASKTLNMISYVYSQELRKKLRIEDDNLKGISLLCSRSKYFLFLLISNIKRLNKLSHDLVRITK